MISIDVTFERRCKKKLKHVEIGSKVLATDENRELIVTSLLNGKSYWADFTAQYVEYSVRDQYGLEVPMGRWFSFDSDNWVIID